MGSVLRLRDVRHRRGGREVLAIDELDLDAGERLAVLGPNGAGKTTLLRLLAALDTPTAGSVQLDGVSTAGADVRLRRRIGYATQRPGLLSTSVIRNVELPLRWRGFDRATRRSAAQGALERLGVARLADRKALSLSGGEAQRVSLARALALEPQLLLLDEPAAGLDAEARQAFLDDLEAALAGRSATVVHVSHRAEEALRLADRVALLVDGVIRQIGTPASVVQQPGDATIAKLVGYDNVLPVHIDRSGEVLIGGASSGARVTAPPGPATLAAWGAAIRIGPPGSGPLSATVKQVSPGPGHWNVTLVAGETLRAHVPLHHKPPQVGERTAVQLALKHAAVISGSGRSDTAVREGCPERASDSVAPRTAAPRR
jgi:ABC-type sulfate/molybdate transport systems ATPase subunit